MTEAPRRKKSADRELKKERIELRVASSAKQLIRRAMAVSGLTAGDLAYEGARHVLEEHERMVLASLAEKRSSRLTSRTNCAAPLTLSRSQTAAPNRWRRRCAFCC